MSSAAEHAPVVRLLVVCTMNQARSPLAEVIARDQLARHGVPAAVASAGIAVTDGGGKPAVAGSLHAASKLGLDLRDHRSRPVTEELVAWSNLIVAMERRHVIDLVADRGADFATTYTLPELAMYVEFGTRVRSDEPIGEWLRRLTVYRRAETLLGGPEAPGEISDPMGLRRRQFRRVAADMVSYFATVAAAAAPVPQIVRP